MDLKFNIGYIILLSNTLFAAISAKQFNFEVEKRIVDRLSFYLDAPVETTKVVANYRRHGGFDNNLLAPDRDDFLTFAMSLEQPGVVYYALEDGTFAGNQVTSGVYREPGDMGYDVNDPEMQKHYHSCIDLGAGDGTPIECKLAPGSPYVQCFDDKCTELVPCPDDSSQSNCDIIEVKEERDACYRAIKYCVQYSIKSAPADVTDTGLGAIPVTQACINEHGRFSQELGGVIKSDGGFGNCYHLDETTLVHQNLEGSYAFCGLDGENCNNTFAGVYVTAAFDPRFRPWYIITKEQQAPNWSPPYPFYDLGMGITFERPIYSQQDGKEVFAGVVAYDYRFEDIANFLVENYGNSETSVVIFETDEPHYVIAASSGTPAVNLQLTHDLSQPCPVDSGLNVPCTPVRIAMTDLRGTNEDDILRRAFVRHNEAGYPQDLLSVTANNGINSDFFVSQSTLYEQSGATLKWRVVVVEPGTKSASDTIGSGSFLFLVLIIVAIIGFLICIAMLIIFYGKRDEPAVIHADWRFTCAFILGCALFNVVMLTRLGPNTNAMCLIRQWTFHLHFVAVLAPLFVKIWRMHQLVGKSKIRRLAISNFTTAMYTLPMILTQATILLIFSFADPPRQTEIIENIDGVISQRIVCETQTSAFFIVEFLFEAGFILVGCVLAYLTRNMDEKFGESKQLIFAMYNIALVGAIIVIIAGLGGIDPSGASALVTFGVFWGTVFSSAAFVMPRIMEVRQDHKRNKTHSQSNQSGRSRVYVSGLELPTGGSKEFGLSSEVEFKPPQEVAPVLMPSKVMASSTDDEIREEQPPGSPMSAREKKRSIEAQFKETTFPAMVELEHCKEPSISAFEIEPKANNDHCQKKNGSLISFKMQQSVKMHKSGVLLLDSDDEIDDSDDNGDDDNA